MPGMPPPSRPRPGVPPEQSEAEDLAGEMAGPLYRHARDSVQWLSSVVLGGGVPDGVYKKSTPIKVPPELGGGPKGGHGHGHGNGGGRVQTVGPSWRRPRDGLLGLGCVVLLCMVTLGFYGNFTSQRSPASLPPPDAAAAAVIHYDQQQQQRRSEKHRLKREERRQAREAEKAAQRAEPMVLDARAPLPVARPTAAASQLADRFRERLAAASNPSRLHVPSPYALATASPAPAPRASSPRSSVASHHHHQHTALSVMTDQLPARRSHSGAAGAILREHATPRPLLASQTAGHHHHVEDVPHPHKFHDGYQEKNERFLKESDLRAEREAVDPVAAGMPVAGFGETAEGSEGGNAHAVPVAPAKPKVKVPTIKPPRQKADYRPFKALQNLISRTPPSPPKPPPPPDVCDPPTCLCRMSEISCRKEYCSAKTKKQALQQYLPMKELGMPVHASDRRNHSYEIQDFIRHKEGYIPVGTDMEWFPDYKRVFPGLNFRRASCAIVGNSGVLSLTKYGKAIDAHDIVIRVNQAPTREPPNTGDELSGYEAVVGEKTHMRLLNAMWSSNYGFTYKHKIYQLPMERDIALIVSRGEQLVPNFMKLREFLGSYRRPDVKAYMIQQRAVTKTKQFLSMFRNCLFHNGETFEGGRVPSSGLVAVYSLKNLCKHTTAFGFGSHPRANYQYYELHGTHRSVGNVASHSFSAEYSLLTHMANSGLVTVCTADRSKPCFGAPLAPAARREIPNYRYERPVVNSLLLYRPGMPGDDAQEELLRNTTFLEEGGLADNDAQSDHADSSATPEDATEATPEDAPEATPEEAPEATPEEAPETTPETVETESGSKDNGSTDDASSEEV